MSGTWWAIKHITLMGEELYLTGDWAPKFEWMPKLPMRFASKRSAETHAAGVVLQQPQLIGRVSVEEIRVTNRGWDVRV